MQDEIVKSEVNYSDNPVRVHNQIMRELYPDDPPQLPKDMEDFCDEIVEFEA